MNKLEMILQIDVKEARASLQAIREYFSNVKNLFKDPSEIDVETEKAEAKLDAIEAKFDALENVEIKIDGNASGADKAANEAETAVGGIPDEHNTEIDGDASGLDNAVEKTKGIFDGLMGKLAQFGLAMSAVKQSFEVLQRSFNNFISPASEFEQLRIRLVNLYQDTEKASEVFEQFKQIAATTPFSLQEVVEAGATLKAFGMNAEETLKSITDLAAYMGVDVVSAAGAVGRAFAGGAGAADVLRERGVLELIRSFKGIDDLTKLSLPQFREAMLETFQDTTAGIAGSTTRLSESYAGAVSNMKDAWTNLMAAVGNKILPLLTEGVRNLTTVISGLLEGMEKMITVIKSLVAAGMSYSVTMAIMNAKVIALTVKTIAYNVALAVKNALLGKWVALAAAAVAAAAVYSLSTIRVKNSVDGLNDSTEKSNKSLETQEERFKNLREAAEAYSKALDYQQAKESLKEVSKEIDELLKSVNATRTDDFVDISLLPPEKQVTLLAQYEELAAKEEALKEKVRTADKAASEEYYKYKADLDHEATLQGIELAEYRLDKAREEYEEVGKIDAGNLERKKELYAEIMKLESEIAASKERLNENPENGSAAELEKERLAMVQHYANLSELSAVNLDNMKQDFDEYLEKAKGVYGEESEKYQQIKEELEQIEQASNMRIIQEKGNFVARMNDLAGADTNAILLKYQQVMEELKRLYAENSEEYKRYQGIITESSAEQVLNRYSQEEESFDDKMKFIEDYFAANRDILKANGMSEVDIVKTKNQAIENLEAASLQNRIAQGAQGLGQMANNITGFGKVGFEASKALNIAQIIMEAPAAAMGAYKSVIGIPYVGPVLAPLAFAASLAQSAMSIKKIKETKYEKAESGGLLRGKSHTEGGVIIEAEGGEYINKKSRVAELGTGLFNFINNAPLKTVINALQGIQLPDIPMPSMPQMVFAGGGYVGNSNIGIIDKLDELIGENRELRRELKEKRLIVNNQISANEVIRKADSTLINERNNEGEIRRNLI